MRRLSDISQVIFYSIKFSTQFKLNILFYKNDPEDLHFLLLRKYKNWLYSCVLKRNRCLTYIELADEFP